MVRHILKDGSVKTDLTGYIVKRQYAEPLYQLMTSINGSSGKRKKRLV